MRFVLGKHSTQNTLINWSITCKRWSNATGNGAELSN
jgi:hypothetical protein